MLVLIMFTIMPLLIGRHYIFMIDTSKSILNQNKETGCEMVTILTPSGRFLYVSSICVEILGFNQEEIVGSLLQDYIHPDDLFVLESRFFDIGKQGICTYRMKKVDNTYIWVESLIQFTFDKQGKVIEILANSKIINRTEQVKEPSGENFKKDVLRNDSVYTNDHVNTIENQLKYIQEVSYTLIEESPYGIIICQKGEIVYSNPTATNVLGGKVQKDIFGRNALEFISKEYREIVESWVKSVHTGNPIGPFEQKWKRLDGKNIDIEMKVSSTTYKGEKAEYIVFLDISSRKKYEKVLQQSRERYRHIIQNSIDTIAVIHNNEWGFINDSGVKMFGGSHYTELIGKSIFEFLHPDCQHEVKTHLETVLVKKKKIGITNQSWYKLDGTLIYTELIGIPITFQNKPAIQVIIRDITERKRTEQLMIKSEKLSVAGQLAAGIAHEIRNPLTAIKGFLQLLNSGIDEKQQYYEIMLSELNRIELILSELLVLSKPKEVLFRKTKVRSLLKDVVTLLDTQANMNNVQIELLIYDENLVINCDENQMKQVFINFIKNSIDAMPKGGMIFIRVKQENDKVKISFIDQGCGIPEEVLKKVGEPFYTTKEKGTGLGVMISYNIIENHNGLVSVTSKVNAGTTFEVTLPLSH